MKSIGFYSVCLAMLLSTPLLSPRRELAAQDLNGAFRHTIQHAQKRVVKVYGATAGRVDGYASGLIVSPDGKVVTQQGVYLEGHNVRVTLPDGSTHPATVLRRNRRLQLALLQLSVETPEYFELDTDPVGDKGDWVIAISNAFKVADGIEPLSVNLGVISLRTFIEARITPRDVAYEGDLVLIDCITSNPGAAGGAVVNEGGQLVGMIGKVINSSETNTRLNYAVPSPLLKQFVDGELTESTAQLPSSGKPAWLGIRLFELSGRQAPAYIDRVLPDSPADAAELRPDDLIISMAGEKITTIDDFRKVLATIEPQQEVILVVKRGSQLIRVALTAEEEKR